MIFHENCLLANHSLFLSKIRKDVQNLSSAAVVIGALRDNSGYLQTGTLANSEDPDEMPHLIMAFHQCLHYFQIQNQIFNTKMQHNLTP